MRVRMVGGGGGGAGGGVAGSPGNGSSGGTTTFGTSLLSATGGINNVGLGTGGTVTVLAPAIAIITIAGQSTGFSANVGSNNNYPGPIPGGNSMLGFGGASFVNQAGASASGYGGGGGGGNSTATTTGPDRYNGAGGGGGGGVEAVITGSLQTSYPYSVGAGGNGGTAGTQGYPGGVGSSGVIIIEEYSA